MSSADRWVCLIYHDVTARPATSDGSSGYFTVPEKAFERQLSIIADLGLRGCSIADAIAAPGTNRVAISFDDGDLGQATRAFPALAKRGMTATFFVTTSWMGKPTYASWEQLREMRAAGMSIQSHTHTHPFLSELGPEALREELARSRDVLDEQMGQRTDMIAFPGGDAPREDLRHMLQEQRYSVIGTSRWGRNRDTDSGVPRYLRRCTVRGEPSDSLFAAIARGDSLLAMKKTTRERVLAFIRSSLGPTRYARWRRSLLDAVSPSDARQT